APLYINPCSVTTIMSARPSQSRQSSIDQETTRMLEQMLANRPDKATLVDRNILKDDNGLAPSLVAAKEKLQRSQLEDQLANAIAQRPSRQELEKSGILRASEGEAGAPAST
ncbi:hypothetical protein GGX14DRAFT_451799, partial [Mycena pura]